MKPQPYPPGDARVETDGDARAVVLVRGLPGPPAPVWAALTDPDVLTRWAPYTAGTALDAPGDATLVLLDGDARTPLAATVRRAEPPTLLAHTFGADELRWRLEPDHAGTRLTLRQALADPGAAATTAAGWHLCLEVLRHLLGGAPVPPVRGRAALEHGFGPVRDAYERRFAAEGW